MLDQGYSWDLTDEDAQELGRRSICAAGHRDAFSGNTINLYHVRENGWEFIGELLKTRELTADNYDLSEMWYKYANEKQEKVAAAQAAQGEPIAVE